MNRLKWFFISGRKKLLYQIECAKANKQRLCLSNGILLDFTEERMTFADFLASNELPPIHTVVEPPIPFNKTYEIIEYVFGDDGEWVKILIDNDFEIFWSLDQLKRCTIKEVTK